MIYISIPTASQQQLPVKNVKTTLREPILLVQKLPGNTAVPLENQLEHVVTAHVLELRAAQVVNQIVEHVKPCGVETGLVTTEKHKHLVQQIVGLPIIVEITLVMVEKTVILVLMTVELVTHHPVVMAPVVVESGVETVALTVDHVPLVEMAHVMVEKAVAVVLPTVVRVLLVEMAHVMVAKHVILVLLTADPVEVLSVETLHVTHLKLAAPVPKTVGLVKKMKLGSKSLLVM